MAEDKRYADLRLKMGSKKSPDREDIESLPSEISLTDAWGELPKFMDKKHQEAQRKEKENLAAKREAVRKTLDV